MSLGRAIRGEGPRNASSFWVGHAPGVDELRSGRPWTGPAGRLLNSLLYKESIDRASIFITNLRDHMPGPGSSPLYSEATLEHLEFDLTKVEPPVLVTMGLEAARWALGPVVLEAVHGLPWRLPATTHYPRHLRPPVVVPIYNPAYAMQSEEAYKYVAFDVHQVRRVLSGEVAPRQIRDQYPNPQYSIGFVSYPDHRRVFVDTEGWVHAPHCLSYTCVPGVGHIILATDKKGLRQFQELLDEMDEVVLHSAIYDLPVLRAMGVYVRGEQLRDTKVLTYVTQVEPQGLKPLGFRHAGMVMQSYEELTAPYDFIQAFEYLEQVNELDWGKPDPVLELRDGKPYVKQPQGLNTRLKSIFTAIAKGAAPAEEDEAEEEESEEEGEAKEVDPRKRWYKIDPEVRRPAEEQLGPMPEFSLSLVPESEWVPYAGRDSDATCRIYEPLLDLVTSGGHLPVYETDLAALPMVERMQANGILVKKGYFEQIGAYFQTEMDRIRKQIEVYNRGEYFNPGSSQQTAKLLFERLRLPVLKLTKGRKPSTQDKVLESLRGRHPAVGLTCDWRELATLKDKFADKLPLYISPVDGRARGKIRDTTVVSGRYSMSDPNLMAIPVRTKIGKRIREGFIAGPGNLLGTADFDQIEMRVMADLSGDAEMIRIFKEGRDVHSENAALMFGVPLEEVNTPEGKLLYRYPAKRVGFGIITGITELGLYDQMRLAGIDKYSVRDCAGIISSYFRVKPGIDRFIHATRQEAIRQGYVRDKSGRIRYLPGVYSQIPGIREEALRQSHSHKISGTAQWIKKRAMARIWTEIRDLPRGEVEPLLEVHDEILMEFKQERESWVEQMMTTIMSQDSDLFKVPIKAKFTSGPNWGVLKD